MKPYITPNDDRDYTDTVKFQKKKYKDITNNGVIENPCYHCYAGASGQCYMTNCKHQFESWAKDVESEYVQIDK